MYSAGQMRARAQDLRRSPPLPEFRRHSLTGDVEGALRLLRQSLARRPDDAASHSALLLLMHYNAVDAQALYGEHVRWADRHARVPVSRHLNSSEAERTLKVGYVSGDFINGHPVGFFIEPVLRTHDRGRFHVTCYSNALEGKPTTRFQSPADGWRDIRGVCDADAAERIRADGIDLLVDLGGHCASGRLGIFARKPAPVQFTWLGYPDTTGLTTIDYRFTDSTADPAGIADRYHSEKLIRLERSFLCYQPPDEAPPVSALPAWFTGQVTFGSFAFPAKITDEVIAAWSQILKRIPTSRLLLHHCFSDYADPRGAVRERLLAKLCRLGVGENRIHFAGFVRPLRDHLQMYSHVDVGLDTFPYNGATTTCESLWMGVPVISLKGSCHAGRVGASILTTVGLGGLVASRAEEYVDRAVALASDLDQLAAMRASLRGVMERSPLLDSISFTRGLEDCYREAWRKWCSNGSIPCES